MYPPKSLSSCSHVIQGCFIIIKSSLLAVWKSKVNKKYERPAEVQVCMTVLIQGAACREMSCSDCCTLRKMLFVILIKNLWCFLYIHWIFINLLVPPAWFGREALQLSQVLTMDFSCQNYLLLDKKTLRKLCDLNIQHMWSSSLKNMKCQWYL